MADFKQIADLVNQTTKEIIGETAVLQEDLSNVVDFGAALIGADSNNKWLPSFVDRIGAVIMYDRVYKSSTNLGIYKNNLDYGTMLQRMMIDELPEAEENETWELQDGVSVDPFVVKLPKASAQYFNKRSTWEVDMTILDKQYRSAFTSPTALASFVAMVQNAVENSKTLKIESLQKAILRVAIASTVADDLPSGDYTQTGVKAINLLNLYNGTSGTLTAADALRNKEFLRFASLTINEYVRAIQDMSVLFNVEGAARFTSKDKMRVAMLGKFADAAQYYLEADTFNENLVKLPGASIVDNWQGTGTSRDLVSLSTVNVKDGTLEVNIPYVLATIYDEDGMGVTAENYRVNTAYNAKGEYTNFFHKSEFASVLFKDMNNIVFFMG